MLHSVVYHLMARNDHKLEPEIRIRESVTGLTLLHCLSLVDKPLAARLEGKVEVAEITSGEESRRLIRKIIKIWTSMYLPLTIINLRKSNMISCF